MTTHELKTWPEPFDAIWNGKKTFEVRKNDRGFEVGDVVVLREYTPSTGVYSGRQVSAKIGYVLTGWGLPDGICVFSLLDYLAQSADHPASPSDAARAEHYGLTEGDK